MKINLAKDILKLSTNKDVDHGYLYGSVTKNEDKVIADGDCLYEVFLEECNDNEIVIDKSLEKKERYYYKDNYILYNRKLPFIGDIRFSVEKKETSLVVKYGKNYRRYSEILLFRHDLPERIASIFTYWGLLERKILSLHCSAAHKDGKTILIFAAPDTGKTQTVMNLVTKSGWKLISDDIALTDGKKAYSVPYTRSGVWEWDENRFRTKKHPLSMRTIKSRVIDYFKQEFSSDLDDKIKLVSDITGIFIIERGNDSLVTLKETEAISTLFAMNALEFYNISNRHLWYSATLAKMFNMHELISTEMDLIESIVMSSGNVFKLKCDHPNKFYQEIEKILSKDIANK